MKLLTSFITYLYKLPVPMGERFEARTAWDPGFESHSRHGYMSAFFCVVLSCV